MSDKAFDGLGFVPNEKELELFQKEKMDMYKGTFIVCLVYGICAFLLLLIIFYTSWGKEFLYKKMLPFVVTFVVGAIFIIVFLSFTINELKPIKLRNIIDKDSDVICPDYWVLKPINNDVKNELISNNDKKIFQDIVSINDDALKYKCELDPNVFGNLKEYSGMKNSLYDGKTQLYKQGKKKITSSKTEPDYLYVEKLDPSANDQNNQVPYSSDKLENYAKFSSLYKNDSTIGNLNNSVVKMDSTAVESTKTPLICNVVYPQVLAKLDKDTPEQNKYRCEYAKACDIPWTDIGCPYSPPS